MSNDNASGTQDLLAQITAMRAEQQQFLKELQDLKERIKTVDARFKAANEQSRGDKAVIVAAIGVATLLVLAAVAHATDVASKPIVVLMRPQGGSLGNQVA